MKKLFKIIIIFLLGVFLLTSCEKEINKYTLKDLGTAANTPNAPIVDLVAETFCSIIISPSAAEIRTYYLVLNDGEETPDQYSVIAGSADVVASGYIEPEAVTNDTITIGNLDMESVYDIYTFAVSATGIASAYSSAVTVTTFDASLPYITVYSPAKGEVIYDMNQSLILTFNEPVTYVATKEITLYSDYASYNETISSDNIVVDGNIVTLLHTEWPYYDYINLSIEEGAFVDEYSNASAAILGYPDTPNFWFETGLPPASEFLGTWTVTEYSLYADAGDPIISYDVTITAGETDNQLIIDPLWSVLTVGGEPVIATIIEFDQETGNVVCPLQNTGWSYVGPIYASYTSAFNVEEGVYGAYEPGYIYFEAKLYDSEVGIFDQVQFELVPAAPKSKVEKPIIYNKLFNTKDYQVKEKF